MCCAVLCVVLRFFTSPLPPFHQVGHAEVSVLGLDPSASAPDALALSQRLAARQPGTDTWRGFSVSTPFLPGEEV